MKFDTDNPIFTNMPFVDAAAVDGSNIAVAVRVNRNRLV